MEVTSVIISIYLSIGDETSSIVYTGPGFNQGTPHEKIWDKDILYSDFPCMVHSSLRRNEDCKKGARCHNYLQGLTCLSKPRHGIVT